MKVAFIGYRSWASRIFENLTKIENPPWTIVDPSEADVVLYYGWSWKIPKEMYENKLCLILHTSPLPKYRGGSPLQNQIINGEKTSAITILKVAEKIDTGNIYAQANFSLEGTIDQIFDRIVEVGTDYTIKVLNNIFIDPTGILEASGYPVKQDESQATYFKRRKPEESELTIEDFKNKTAEELYNFIRALGDPYPNAFIRCADGRKLYLTGVKLDEQD